MDDKVVELQDKRTVCDNLVELVESILVDVKKGVIVAGSFTVVQHDGTTGNGFAGGYPVQQLGELEVLKREIIDCEVDLRMHESGTHY